MWRLNINEPERDSYLVELQPDSTSIGRGSQNKIVLIDSAASRNHAEILLDNLLGTITIHDLNSTNGTYVNRKRISAVVPLHHNDNIRIGKAILNLSTDDNNVRSTVMGTHFYTREIILESLDEHGVLIDDLAQKLNSVMDVQSALDEITGQLRHVLLVEDINVVLAAQFQSIFDARAVAAIQNRSVEVTSTRMYIPIIHSDELQGMIIMSRATDARPFSRRDLELAIAISHQAALTLNRLSLIETSREQQRVRELLLRFVSPLEVDYLLKDYLKSGKLPELVEQKATILFSDIADSTGIAERIGAKRFAELLTHYYQDVTEIIFRYGGIIKYLGDGIMASFLSTSHTQMLISQELRAVYAGWEIAERFRESRYSSGDEPLVIGIAVNTGTAMVGYIGVGSRTEFNVLGDTVNIASRMEPYARPNRLVVGPITMDAIADRFMTQHAGEVEVRGRSASVEIYEVLSKRT